MKKMKIMKIMRMKMRNSLKRIIKKNNNKMKNKSKFNFYHKDKQ